MESVIRKTKVNTHSFSAVDSRTRPFLIQIWVWGRNPNVCLAEGEIQIWIPLQNSNLGFPLPQNSNLNFSLPRNSYSDSPSKLRFGFHPQNSNSDFQSQIWLFPSPKPKFGFSLKTQIWISVSPKQIWISLKTQIWIWISSSVGTQKCIFSKLKIGFLPPSKLKFGFSPLQNSNLGQKPRCYTTLSLYNNFI